MEEVLTRLHKILALVLLVSYEFRGRRELILC